MANTRVDHTVEHVYQQVNHDDQSRDQQHSALHDRIVAALECVDYVVVFGEDEPRDLIAAILPDVLVKGADWAHYVSGRDVVEANGGRVVLANLVEGRSTTGMIDRIVAAYGRREPPAGG